MSLAAILAAASLAAPDAECAVLTAAAADIAQEKTFQSDDVSRIAISANALAPPSGGPNEFKGFRKSPGRRDLTDCPGWLDQMKAARRAVVTPTVRQTTYPGPSGLDWFSRPAFSPDGKSARLIFGKGGDWGGIILTLRLTPAGWVADEERTIFITTD